MIKSFRSNVAEAIYDGVATRNTRKIPGHLHKIVARKLDQLNAAVILEDLKAPPNNKLEKLKGDLLGFYSIRVNDQYRVIFRWQHKDAYDVDIVDYHK